MQPERMHIEFGAEAVADLRDRLARTRWPGDFGNDDWRYGANQEWMEETLAYWRDGFDWRAQEAKLNGFRQFTVPLAAIPVRKPAVSHDICKR